MLFEYNKPPIPFAGNKAPIKEKLIKILENSLITKTKVIDLFGGSFFISYLCKSINPNCEIICNDFDGYANRLEKWETTNDQLEKIKSLFVVDDKNINTKMSDEDDLKIKSFLWDQDFVDWQTMGHKFCYSGSFVKDKDSFLHHRLYYKKIDLIKDPSNYTKNINFVCEDWKILWDKYKYEKNVLFIADPPYLKTENRLYRNFNIDHRHLIRCMKKRTHFIYFTSNKNTLSNFFLDTPCSMEIVERYKINAHSYANMEIIIYR